MKSNDFRILRVLTLFLVLAIPVAAGLPARADVQPPAFITAWGSPGSGEGQFATPVAVAVANSRVYVSDNGYHRIQVFTDTGAYITGWGSFGSLAGQFNSPTGVAVDTEGNVYVADLVNDRIQKFTKDGAFILQWGTRGTGVGQFWGPNCVAIGPGNTVYVDDRDNDRIEVFTSSGAFLRQWSMVELPDGLAVDLIGNVYVAEIGIGAGVAKYSSSGELITKWGTVKGSGPGQFMDPVRVATDPNNLVYVVDNGNSRVQVFTPDGTYLTQWGSEGAATGQFLDPIGIAVDSFGNVYVADTNNYRIQKFGNLPPACSHAAADPAQIWPPNHQLVLVAITGVTDPDGDPVTITVTDVTQNEPLSGEGDGNSCPDAVVANGAAQVRAERSGGGNGRVYTISFAASDGQGGTCNGSVAVCVPHDLGQDGPGDRLDLPALHRGDPGAPRRPSRPRDEQVCVDDGQRFNSLGPCPAPRDIGAQALTNVTLRVGSRRGNTVTLEYSLPTASDVTIALYDIAGRRMTTLLNGSQDQGMHQLSWNSGSLKRGMYFIRLQAGAVVVTKSILVL